MSGLFRHLAIVSDQPAIVSQFYRELFGLKGSPPLEGGAAVVSDGYVGLNVNPRAPGRQGGFDHFGFEVEDVADVESRLKDDYDAIELSRRPGNRPFAGITMHDPVGNVFDLSQKDMENRRDLYVDDVSDMPRRIDHFVLRVVEAERATRFYTHVFDLDEIEKGPTDPSSYLTDGKVTMVVSPWRIDDYLGSGIERPALEHIGFKVESIDAVLADLQAMAERNPQLAPKPWKAGGEGEVRAKLLARCKRGQYQICDPDGVLIDLTED